MTVEVSVHVELVIWYWTSDETVYDGRRAQPSTKSLTHGRKARERKKSGVPKALPRTCSQGLKNLLAGLPLSGPATVSEALSL